MTWGELPAPSTYEKARRKEAYSRFASLVKGQRRRALLSVDEVKDRIHVFEQAYVGVRPIAVADVVGTVDRTREFDKDFLPKSPDVRERWKRVEKAFPQGEFPPIVVYQIEDSFFVVDGHHRVAIAKQRKQEFIDAEITRLRSRITFSKDMDLGNLIHAEQQMIFMESSGLARARPEAVIECSLPPGYLELYELIELHAYHLSHERGELVGMEEASGDWYDTLYLPTVSTIRSERLDEAFPEATDADLYLYAYQRRRSLFPERGDMPIADSMRDVSRPRKLRARPRAKGD